VCGKSWKLSRNSCECAKFPSIFLDFIETKVVGTKKEQLKAATGRTRSACVDCVKGLLVHAHDMTLF
jgi:hypothetical protein